MQIAPQVHKVDGLVANTYVITHPDGLTIIDSALPNNAGKIDKFIRSLGYQRTDVRRILITHSDLDHVGSLAALKALTQATVAASQIEAGAIQLGKPSRPLKTYGLMGLFLKVMEALFKARPAQVDEILKESDELPVLGGLQVLRTPGHTPGHLSFWSPSTRILFSGDSLRIEPERFTRSQGRNNWDDAESQVSFERQAALHPTVVCGGHGWTDKDIERKFG